MLGKLLGSLLPIGLLLLGSIPVLALLLLLGGIAPEQVLQAVLILAATAFGSGSLGGLVALYGATGPFSRWRLSAVPGPVPLPGAGGGLVALSECRDGQDGGSVARPIPGPAKCAGPRRVASHFLHPAYGYFIVMLGIGAALNAVGICGCAKWNPRGEPIMQRERLDDDEKDRANAHAAPGRVRQVWQNPILWRECDAGLRPPAAAGQSRLFPRAGPDLLLRAGRFRQRRPAGVRGRLRAGPVAILSLLLVSAQAVTAITSERDGGALDLLLVTDLSPKEFIFGKLLGIPVTRRNSCSRR